MESTPKDSRLFREPIDPPMDEAELAVLNERNTGLAHTIGMRITHCASDRLEGYVDVGPEHLQVAGIVNGGTYAAIGESLGSVAAIAAAGRPAVGMSNYTDLIASVREGERIDAVALPVHVGSRTHLWRIDMTSGGKLVAVTNLKLMILEM